MRIAEPRVEPAGECLVDQDGVEIHRHFGDADAMASGRNAGMQVGQRLLVREPNGFRHESLDELLHPIGPINEALENLVGIDTPIPATAFVEPSLGARSLLSL